MDRKRSSASRIDSPRGTGRRLARRTWTSRLFRRRSRRLGIRPGKIDVVARYAIVNTRGS